MNKLLILFLLLFFKAEAQSSALQLADSLFTYGEYSKAIKAYKPLENQAAVSQKIAKAYIAIGNYDEALKYYEKAIATQKENQLYQYEYAKLLLRLKKFEAAQQNFTELTEKNKTNPNYQYELGRVKQVQADSTCVSNYLKAYELDPQHLKVINQLGRYALGKRDFLQAIKMADNGLKIYSKSKDFSSLKAQAYYWQELYYEAIEWFEKRLELGEPTQFIYEKLAFCYSKNFNHKKAVENLEKALKFDPKNGLNLYLLGREYSRLEDFENAEKYLLQAIEILDEPMDSEYRELGIVYNRQKKYKEAIDSYKKALRENPKDMMLPFYLALTKSKYYKDYDAKIKVFEDFKKNYPKSPLMLMIDRELEKLRKEQFMKEEEKKKD